MIALISLYISQAGTPPNMGIGEERPFTGHAIALEVNLIVVQSDVQSCLDGIESKVSA